MYGMSTAISLALVPSASMLVMSALVYVVSVPKEAVRAMQHLAAGIVLSAVAVELVPILSAAPADAPNIIAIVVGFTAGVALFLLIGRFCPEDAEEDPKAEALMNRRTSARGSSRVASMFKSASAPAFPFALTVAVLVDSFVDGFLVGISSATGQSAGVVMAIALTIEMGFLALTFAATMQKQPLAIGLSCIVAAPSILFCGACIGAGVATIVSGALHTALISFGISALLYLVPEELLLEAHEGQEEEHVWYVDMFFFVGFLASFLLEKFGGS